MKILDILTSPWAIQPEKLLEIQAIYATHLRGDKIDLGAVEKRLGKPLANDRQPYQIRDGVAVIDMSGVIAKRMNLFSQISGGVSTEMAASDIQAAIIDPSAHSIILNIDSPGGTADGTQALANVIFAARSQKPIVALANGVMASAAYWIGSAANAVYIADGTTQVGSIGVVATHTDVSVAEALQGVKTTEIYAGKFKRIASSYAPLSDAGRQTIQDQVDYLYSIFVADVARQRGVSEEKVLQDMADARVFIGQQAVAAGLVDGVATLDGLVADLNRNRSQGGVRANHKQTTQPQGANMNIEQIKAEHPDLYAAIVAEGHDAAFTAGALAERERIQAVEGQLIPGHEALIASLKFDGKTSGPEAAVKVLAAENGARTSALARLRGDAPGLAATVALQDESAAAAAAAAADNNLPLEEKAKAAWDSNAAVRGEFRTFEAYLAYEKAMASGRVKQLKNHAAA